MQTLTKRFGGLAGFLLMLAVLFANGVVLRRQLARITSTQAWLSHTREVLLELAATESSVKDAETGQRGYLYTGDTKYLAPYTDAQMQLNQHLDILERLTADNPVQQARIKTLRQFTARKMAELAQTISLTQAGKAEEAKAIVLSDAGLTLMNDIHTTVEQMSAEERGLETERAAAYQRSIDTTILCLYLASFLAVAGLALLAYYITREMALRTKHAAQLLEREEWFRVTLTSLGDAVIATDDRGNVTYLNPLAEKLIGAKLTEVKGRTISEVFPIFNESTHLPVENPVAKVVEFGHVVGLANHTVLKSRDGSLIPIEDSAAPIRDTKDKLIGVVLVFRDATRDRKTQEILRETEKLNSAARMSATVAHEINNPLEAIGNLIYLTKTSLATPDAAREYLEAAEQELERVSHITRQTLGFYRESRVPELVDVQALVENVLRLYSSKLTTKRIQVERDFAACPPMKGMPGELKQAISNLISNAADAARVNGKIRVQVKCIENAGERCIGVLVEDDGPGVAAENADRIFEPFFTTKKDVGTGLGLWVTKEIVERHNGAIRLGTTNGHSLGGAQFHLLLPCEARPLPAQPRLR